MPENPLYTPVAAAQQPIFDDKGVHVGYTVAFTMQKGDVAHTESVDVVVGAEEAARLAADLSEFTSWNKSQVDAHDLIAKANTALDNF